MKTPFERIEGFLISSVSRSFDEICFLFSNSAILIVYNSWTLSGAESLDFLIGKDICHVKIEECNFSIYFEPDIVFGVDVSDDGYRGPEAMCLYFSKETIFVWN